MRIKALFALFATAVETALRPRCERERRKAVSGWGTSAEGKIEASESCRRVSESESVGESSESLRCKRPAARRPCAANGAGHRQHKAVSAAVANKANRALTRFRCLNTAFGLSP